ncbi:hypothetical protein OIO90_000328 [Microbotryomycetes sp. JL221]|nr:hypothetical protein OIO90_000328 [Microbotryomycetes sp. JL221]
MSQSTLPVLSAGMADALAARRNSAPNTQLLPQDVMDDTHTDAARAGLVAPPSPLRQRSPKRISNHNPARNSLTLDRDGRPIRTLDSVPVDLLQSLYLSPSGSMSTGTQTPPTSRPTTPARAELLAPTNQPASASLRSRTRSTDSTSSEQQHQHFSSYEWPKSVQFSSKTIFPPVKKLAIKDRKRILVTGGAGFVGSHLVGHPNFELVRADVVEPFMVEVDQIYHLACPASPKAYQHNAVKTLKTNFLGTMNMLGLAKRVKARILLSSTSEIYGSPEQHPQSEEYWGNVNCVGPRACYDEGKRVAEALTYGYHRQDNVDVRVARIFNCYGPRMRQDDGRLVSNFIVASLRGEDLQVYGDGQATRSLMFVQDLVTGLIKLMSSSYTEPVNIGTEDEATVYEWAKVIRDKVEEMRDRNEIPLSVEDHDTQQDKDQVDHVDDDGPDQRPVAVAEEGSESFDVIEARNKQRRGRRSGIVFSPAVVDDPPRRRPDITRAKTVLGWEPKYSLATGIEETIKYFARLEEESEY